MGVIDALESAFAGKRVFVTGHTGFKGSWLSLWLRRLGAEVYGYALPPRTTPSMFELCDVAADVDHCVGDIRDQAALRTRVGAVAPDIVFHLAAQPLVRESYLDPVATFSSNVMGTVHVLEAIRSLDRPCVVVVISSDKCYQNKDWVWGYRENDPLGGKDAYSASKAGTELVVESWRESFFAESGLVKLASARAGNVVGGGDWAADRIIPDCVRAFCAGRPVELRNPAATRPWQHVLEPLGGYLLLASRMAETDSPALCSSWNFGPAPQDVRRVEEVVGKFCAYLGSNDAWTLSKGSHPAEARMLSLNCDKAINHLGWRPTWSLDEMLEHTAAWYRAWQAGEASLKTTTLGQIAQFEDSVREASGR